MSDYWINVLGVAIVIGIPALIVGYVFLGIFIYDLFEDNSYWRWAKATVVLFVTLPILGLIFGVPALFAVGHR